MSKSYTSLLASDSYIKGILMINQALIMNKSKYPFTVMVTDGVSKDTLNILTKNKINYIKVPFIQPKEEIVKHNELWGKSRFNNTFCKLNIFNLPFEKIVFIDGDMLPLENIDELFNEPHLSACEDNPHLGIDQADYERRLCINSGLMVVENNQEDFNTAINFMNTMDYNKGRPVGDQDVLQNCLKWNYLNQGYNVFAPDLDYYEEPISIKVLHYIKAPKPWNFNSTVEIPARIRGKFPFKAIAMYVMYKKLLEEFKFDF